MDLVLEAYQYRVVVSPRFGASLLAAEWLGGGAPLPILEPLRDPASGFTAGCFLMAPFVNRIADGRFHVDGAPFAIPLNRPEQSMAIHGFSRDRRWQVLEADTAHAVLIDRVESEAHPWRYTARFEVALAPDGIMLSLALHNDGEWHFPFGMGLHPFFPREDGDKVTFTAEGFHASDDRGLPTGPRQTISPARQSHDLAEVQGLDRCFLNAHGSVSVEKPASNVKMDLRARGAFRHLHLFVPEQRPVFCLEPVTHLPDAINRPSLGADAQMTILAPAESLSGHLQLSITPFHK
ncbi:aldose epimerase family protein [Rhizobium paknamense]|uniref:Aldose 1-epimerase n=1 Tax=Rhizobium paknamense TaxID=1206817 RepID=A0ABU0IBU1_9HYPH|nr:hypothetical protein [Rhizobium paknamense]MDQ0455703.1 aldose 1-epimerase [Rhizobium paknamense]